MKKKKYNSHAVTVVNNNRIENCTCISFLSWTWLESVEQRWPWIRMNNRHENICDKRDMQRVRLKIEDWRLNIEEKKEFEYKFKVSWAILRRFRTISFYLTFNSTELSSYCEVCISCINDFCIPTYYHSGFLFLFIVVVTYLVFLLRFINQRCYSPVTSIVISDILNPTFFKTT